jgi:glycosyltransferase involved in cell wall biosynthesis
MDILWINELANFKGGCEQYIYNTVKLLKPYHRATLLYNPNHQVDPRFLAVFDAAFPLVDLERQLQELPVDMIYLHQLYKKEDLQVLGRCALPVIRFLHDLWLFCLRRHKLHYFNDHFYPPTVNFSNYPLGLTLNRKEEAFFGLELNTIGKLKAEQRLTQQLDGVVVASQFMAETASMNGFERGKVHTIPLYALDLMPKPVAREQRLLLYVGQLIRGKGLDVAIKALKILGPSYRLAIIGSGRQEPHYRSLVKRLEVGAQVAFLGSLPHEELATWYQRAACLVMPSRTPEPFGLVGLEAMRCRTPVLGSRLGAIPEWLEDGKTGLLVAANDPQALAEAVRELDAAPALVSTFGEKARQSFKEKYVPQHHLDQLQTLFREIIALKKRKREWGRCTLCGSDQLEQEIQQILVEVIRLICRSLPSDSYHALLLIGGYGKGEGGVEWRAGREHPHNNLDLLLITADHSLSKEQVDKLLDPIRSTHQIGIDFSMIPLKKLRGSSPTLIWYDMMKGHKLLIGDPELISSLSFADLKQVPSEQILDLMVNRGTLLVINDWMMERILSEEQRKLAIRHLMKAIIGFGDALLYFKHEYHWSYNEKRLRMQKQLTIPDNFRRLYEQAATFRFKPNYESFAAVDLAAWTAELRPLLADLYLQCERLRLRQPELSWDSYLEMMLSHSLLSFRTMKQKVKGMVNLPNYFMGKSPLSKLGFWTTPPRQRLAAIFPLIAFQKNSDYTKQAAQFLQAESEQPVALRRAYLEQWGKTNDINFKLKREGR